MKALKVAAIGLAIALAPAAANAADIKVVTSVGVDFGSTSFAAIRGRSEHRLKLNYRTAVPLKRQITPARPSTW